MLLLQLSSAQGPQECCLGVAKALLKLQQEAEASKVVLSILEQENGYHTNTLRSVLVSLTGEKEQLLAERWTGTLQWICASPYRPHHGRKNWFIGGACFTLADSVAEVGVRFETMRASGAGGQHVNTTDSAVRATHLATGISVRVQTERSQHANKRLALLLIGQKLKQQQQSIQAEQKSQRRMFHHHLERGNPKRIFRGEAFNEVR